MANATPVKRRTDEVRSVALRCPSSSPCAIVVINEATEPIVAALWDKDQRTDPRKRVAEHFANDTCSKHNREPMPEVTTARGLLHVHPVDEVSLVGEKVLWLE